MANYYKRREDLTASSISGGLRAWYCTTHPHACPDLTHEPRGHQVGEDSLCSISRYVEPSLKCFNAQRKARVLKNTVDKSPH